MKTNKGKVYGNHSFSVSTHRIPTSIHDEATRLGINISSALEEILTIKIQAMGGSALQGMEDELRRKREEDMLLHSSIETLEKRIDEEKAKIAAAVNDRETSATLQLGPAFVLRKQLQETRWAIVPVLKNIQAKELEPGMKVVQKSEKYITVETPELKIMPDPSVLREKIGSNFSVDKVRSDIFSGTVFTGYIEDVKQRYEVGEWRHYEETKHRKIRDSIIGEMSGTLNVPVDEAKERIENPWVGKREVK
ncbi:MAG: hypothetical protein ACYCT2_04805 [Thermoplasmataceae archaeon]